MSRNDIMERDRGMEDAVDMNKVPSPMPTGPQMVTIEDRPQGALAVAVHRNLETVKQNIRTIANMAGQDFFYRWPVKGKDGKTEWIEGPSVKLTNAVARLYGNCTVKVRAFDQGQHWMIQAQFIDLETGYVLERPFQQRKTQNIGGKMDKDRALDLVFQIGISKATRNVVCNAISDFVDYAFEEAKFDMVSKIGKDLEKYRGKVNDRLRELKVTVDRVEAQIGKTIDKWLAPDVARVIAELQSISDGMADPDEMWPPREAGAPRPATEAADESRQTEQRQETQQTQQQEKPKPKAEAKPKEEAKPQPKADAPAGDESAVARQVSQAIKLAAEGDKPTLDQLDDQVNTLMSREPDEQQNKRWNDAYLIRKNELRSGHKGPSALLEMLPAAEAPIADKAEQLLSWFKDRKDELEGLKNIDDLDPLEESVANELAGDDALLDEWKNLCNAKARSLMGRKR